MRLDVGRMDGVALDPLPQGVVMIARRGGPGGFGGGLRSTPRKGGWGPGLSIEDQLEHLREQLQEQQRCFAEQEQRVHEQQRCVREHEEEMVAMRQAREKDHEVVRCLMDLVEDTVPTADVHAMISRVTDQIGETSDAWRSALSDVDAKLEALTDRAQSFDQHSQELSLKLLSVPDHSAPLQKLEGSIHDIERRLETASGNIAEINIQLLGMTSEDPAASTHIATSAVEERLRVVEVSIERAAVLRDSQFESICRRELALARLQWEHQADEKDESVSAQRHADHSRLQRRIDECVTQHDELAQQVLAHCNDLASLKQSSALVEAKTEVLATGLATVSAHKSGREDAQAAQLSSLRDSLEQLERCAISGRSATLTRC
eukprot:COSAG02_NODE_3733_length_6312_cov_3.880251_8_plen_376_part_00